MLFVILPEAQASASSSKSTTRTRPEFSIITSASKSVYISVTSMVVRSVNNITICIYQMIISVKEFTYFPAFIYTVNRYSMRKFTFRTNGIPFCNDIVFITK